MDASQYIWRDMRMGNVLMNITGAKQIYSIGGIKTEFDTCRLDELVL
jgi:hypothetical protein